MKVVVLLDPILDEDLHLMPPSNGVKEADTGALELAHLLKSTGQANNIWAVSITGPGNDAKSALTFCLSLDADRGTQVICDIDQLWNKRGVALIIKQTIESFGPDLILCGCDITGNCSVGSILAGLLGYSFITGVLSLEYDGFKRNIVATRYIGRRIQESIESDLPAVLGIDAHMKRPHVYPTLKSIRAAVRTPIEKFQVGTTSSESSNNDGMTFLKREPYRIPVKEIVAYPKASSSRDRMRYIIGQSREITDTSSIFFEELDQSVDGFIEFIEKHNLK